MGDPLTMPHLKKFLTRNASGEVSVCVSGLIEEMREIVNLLTQDPVRTPQVTSGELSFRSMVENLPDFIMRFDVNGCCTYINPSLAKILNVQNVVGMRAFELYAGCPQAMDFETKIQHGLAAGEASKCLLCFKNSNGIDCCIDLRMVPERNDEGLVVSILAIGREV